MDTATVTFAE